MNQHTLFRATVVALIATFLAACANMTPPRVKQERVPASPSHLIAGDRALLHTESGRYFMEVKELRDQQVCSVEGQCIAIADITKAEVYRVKDDRQFHWIELLIPATDVDIRWGGFYFKHPRQHTWTVCIGAPDALQFASVSALENANANVMATMSGTGPVVDLGGGLASGGSGLAGLGGALGGLGGLGGVGGALGGLGGGGISLGGLGGVGGGSTGLFGLVALFGLMRLRRPVR